MDDEDVEREPSREKVLKAKRADAQLMSRLHKAVHRYETATGDDRSCFCKPANVKFFVLVSLHLLLVTLGAGVLYAMEGGLVSEDDKSKEEFMIKMQHKFEPAEWAEMQALLGEEPTDPDVEAHTVRETTFGRYWIMAWTGATTIGYGIVCPATEKGQLFYIIWILVAIPISAMAFMSIAERILVFMTWVLTPSKKALRDMFNKYDSDKSGTLHTAEVNAALKDLGLDLEPEVLSTFMTHVDTDGDGVLDELEFGHTVRALHLDFQSEELKQYHVLAVLCMLVAHTTLGTAFFAVSEKVHDWTIINSLYFVVITTTTVGLGDYFPTSNAGYYFLVPWAMVGLGLIALFFNVISDAALEAVHHVEYSSACHMRLCGACCCCCKRSGPKDGAPEREPFLKDDKRQ